jgi:hypothetical protein
VEEVRRLYVFENMVLRKVFGPKGEEVPVVLRRLHNLYFLLCIIALVKSSRGKCVVHILKILFAYKILQGKNCEKS